MDTCKAVSYRIVELCVERNIKLNTLARLSAVPPSTLKNIMYGVSKNPGIVTIKMLCDGLDISLTEFFDCSLFRELEQEIR
ncbi:helix-turn-helix domain-containing protein [Candidatus Soleaferrea massiliensis]|uniref:helix-turn-helix domain-containing protein n=1 Tax=Candidatus Soleaferrea massiliensis TaxID=1470354 RepID=UPI00059167D8|nr:helix-turn-helix transcriptional regulator [Candidatus Soleaferrea massiliensis]